MEKVPQAQPNKYLEEKKNTPLKAIPEKQKRG
jgi:hypothetical protein